MKKSAIAIGLATTMLLASCDLNRTLLGAGVGAGAGAAIGAGIGKVTGNTGLGAAIGTVVGGVAGGLIGKKMEKQRKELEKTMPGAKVEAVNDGQAIRVTLESGILFKLNSSALNTKSKNVLDKFSISLLNNPDTDIKILGFTDNTGSDAINNPLSAKRAQSVKDYLMSKGVGSSRMECQGMGSSDPVASNETAAGRQANRRVEIYILPNEKMKKEAEAGTLR